MKKKWMSLMVTVSMLFIAATGEAAPAAPTMFLSTQGLSVTVSWTPSQGATGYKLCYAAFPWLPSMTMDDIHYLDMGTSTSISFNLWQGAAYYVAIQAYGGQGESEFSNIDYFIMGPPTPEWVDNDGDGFTEIQGDCNDQSPYFYPGAIEYCSDGNDTDCNGADLECDPNIDYDGDGYSENQGDCNILVSGIRPGAVEVCGDAIDQNCDGLDDLCPIDPNDVDNDGDEKTENQGDCNDSEANIYPGAIEINYDGRDSDCNGLDNTVPAYGLPVPKNDTPVGNMVVEHQQGKATVRIIFESREATNARTGQTSYYIFKITQDGQIYNYTRSGWVKHTGGALLSFLSINRTSIYDNPSTELLYNNVNVSSIVGEHLYGGILQGNDFTYNYIGTILPERQITPVAFPFQNQNWIVTRTVDPINDDTSCFLMHYSVNADDLFKVSYYFYKLDKNDIISMSMSLLGIYSGNTIGTPHYGNSVVRIDNNPAVPLNQTTAGVEYTANGFYGPSMIYNNFEPVYSQLVAGNNLVLRYVSSYGTYNYTVSTSAIGFKDAANAFDYCISTQ